MMLQTLFFSHIPFTNVNYFTFNYYQVKLSEKTSLLESAEAKIAELTGKVDEQQKLIQKLEDDILKVSLTSEV